MIIFNFIVCGRLARKRTIQWLENSWNMKHRGTG